MAKRKIDKSREARIDDEIIVDCYGEAERAMGWYCYLEDRLEFPFTAKCIATRSISPLKTGVVVEVIGMESEDENVRDHPMGEAEIRRAAVAVERCQCE
jgi:hypothetical protein